MRFAFGRATTSIAIFNVVAVVVVMRFAFGGGTTSIGIFNVVVAVVAIGSRRLLLINFFGNPVSHCNSLCFLRFTFFLMR